MSLYLCSGLDEVTGDCVSWVAYAGFLPALSIPDALEVGGAALGVFAVAWGVRQMVGLFLSSNR